MFHGYWVEILGKVSDRVLDLHTGSRFYNIHCLAKSIRTVIISIPTFELLEA